MSRKFKSETFRIAWRQGIRCLLTLLILPLGSAMAIEEPKYQVLSAEGPFEHRLYSGYLIAETELPGDFDSASRAGFRRVAGYIFGDLPVVRENFTLLILGIIVVSVMPVVIEAFRAWRAPRADT